MSDFKHKDRPNPMAQENGRPEIHFTPQKGWMNDPNGLVYFKGEYHLFYQHAPDSPDGGPLHWGHAVSKDLLNWQELDIALFPDELGMCFSGSAIVDQNNDSGLFSDQPGLIAFYTAHREKEGFDKGYIEEQCLAYSVDNGRSWAKYSGNPVISSPGCSDIRDPKVIWHENSQSWVMALAVGQEIHFYRSKNLINWHFTSGFGLGEGLHTEHPWECPDLFELQIEDSNESRWVLIVGIGASEDPFGSLTQYFVGRFDGQAFVNENASDTVLMMDEGRDFYAAQTWSDAPMGKRLAIAWMNNWKYAKLTDATDYRGSMTSVRQLGLVETVDGPRLIQTFVTDQDLSHCQIAHAGSVQCELSDDSHISLSFFQADSEELTIRRVGSRAVVEVLRHEDCAPDVQVTLNHSYAFEMDYHTPFELSWRVDTGSLELLLGGGRASMTQLTFGRLPLHSPIIKTLSGLVRVIHLKP